MPPNMEEVVSTYNRLKKEDRDKAMAFLVEFLSTPEAQEAFGHGAKVEFSDEQVAWFEMTLADNKDVRWTFVFLHQPLWDNPEPTESWKQIDAAAQGRDYTFIAGHTHYYDYDLINGHEYITVGCAGAGFTHDGPGNVDMLTWVTMKEDGPEFAGIALKGLFDCRGLDPQKFGAYDRTPKLGAGHGGGEDGAEGPGLSLGIQSVPNLRDLGGYEGASGATVVGGLIFRSNQLAEISDEDMAKIAALGLKTDFDFRTKAERELRPDEVPEGVKEVWLDVLADADDAGPAQLEKLMKDPKAANEALGGGKAAAGFAGSYRDFVSLPSAKKAFGDFFRALADREQLPALFHCTTGKDRTGWAAAAFLTLLGVPKDTIMEDYLRSNKYILPMYQEVIDGFVAAGGEEEIPTSILGVKKEYLEAAFDEMEKKYGTIEKYFAEGLGIDAAGQKALRELYLASPR